MTLPENGRKLGRRSRGLYESTFDCLYKSNKITVVLTFSNMKFPDLENLGVPRRLNIDETKRPQKTPLELMLLAGARKRTREFYEKFKAVKNEDR